MTAGIGSSPPPDPTDGLSGYRKWMDGWMDVFKSVLHLCDFCIVDNALIFLLKLFHLHHRDGAFLVVIQIDLVVFCLS